VKPRARRTTVEMQSDIEIRTARVRTPGFCGEAADGGLTLAMAATIPTPIDASGCEREGGTIVIIDICSVA
jgi:hypothetical protein